MAVATRARTAEVKARSTEEIKQQATELYARWGLSLSDAINIFLVKSVDVGGFPFDVRAPQMPPASVMEQLAYRAPLTEDGVLLLPAEWADGE